MHPLFSSCHAPTTVAGKTCCGDVTTDLTLTRHVSGGQRSQPLYVWIARVRTGHTRNTPIYTPLNIGGFPDIRLYILDLELLLFNL